jgi:hypothetical protein
LHATRIPNKHQGFVRRDSENTQNQPRQKGAKKRNKEEKNADL